MTKFRSFITIGAFSLLVLGIPAIASAQYGGNDPYGRNGGYNNDRYGNMRGIVRSLKDRTHDFQRELDRDLDRSRMNGTRCEDQINGLAREFRNSVDRLSNDLNDRNDQADLQRAMN